MFNPEKKIGASLLVLGMMIPAGHGSGRNNADLRQGANL